MQDHHGDDRAPGPPSDEQLADLSLEEKAALTAGRDVWVVPGIPHLGVPALKMTDGPNGARGAEFTSGEVRSLAVPCGSALAATFDPDLVERVGEVLGREARQKRSRVLLAPTINLIRSPLYGRSFECYGEDPWLSGRLAAAFVRGVQSQGVATTPKHLVGNEAEFQRYTIDSVIDERTLREVYLVPFEWAIRHGGALGIMTSYNRLNGTYCSEDADLLNGILRDEWGFEGFVVSDWFAAGDTVASLEAGMDVQMPGPDRFFGAPVAKAIANGEVDEQHLDAIVDRRIHLHRVLDAWQDEADERELGVEHDADRRLAHEAAAAAMTLLTNGGVLPLDPNVPSVALIGPNARSAHIMGGGSAQLAAHRRVTPAEVLEQRLGDRVTVEPGCVIDKLAPVMRPDGGFVVEFFAGDDWSGPSIGATERRTGRAIWSGEPVNGMGTDSFTARMSGRLTADVGGVHTITLIQTGPSRLLVDGDVVLDGITTRPARSENFFGAGSVEMQAPVMLEAGQTVDVVAEFRADAGTGIRGISVGHRLPVVDDLLDRAAAAAGEAHVAIVVVGTSDEWETEGTDRESIDLPGAQDELVERVCDANPRTVVVVNAGSPVTMPWAERPAAILLSWLGGQEMSSALADVLFGRAEPGGRLPVTFPQRIEHTPAYGNFPGESNRTLYGEGPLIGHRWYDSRHLPVRFPFGHGMSYTTFEWAPPRITDDGAGRVTLEVDVTNSGDRAGSDVVQVYRSAPAGAFTRPRRELIGVAKVQVEAGATATARIELGPRSFAYWNPLDLEHLDLRAKGGAAAMMPTGLEQLTTDARPGWYIDAGDHELEIARSADDTVDRVTVGIAEAQGPLEGDDTLP